MCSNCIYLKAVGCQLPKYWCEAKKQLIAKPEMTGCSDEEMKCSIQTVYNHIDKEGLR